MARSATPRIVAREGDLVVERDPRRLTGRLLRQAEMEASYVDLADASHLEFDYMRWMRIVLRAARARRVLHIGGGACALARALAAEDPSGMSAGLRARRPCAGARPRAPGVRRAPGLRVRHAEGREFVERQPKGSWDAVVIDAFAGALIPRPLITAEALTAIARAAPLALVNTSNRAGRSWRVAAARRGYCRPQRWAVRRQLGADRRRDCPT